MSTWVLVANRTNARIFSGKGKALDRLRVIENEEGRVRDQDLEAGSAARSFDSHAQGRHAPDRGSSSAHEQAAEKFARKLGAELREGRTKFGATRIVLVAEPHFLGVLRSELDGPTSALLSGSVAKDLGAVRDDELAKHLADVMPL